MGMRNYLIFGGVNSADYGIYITGSGVYNAPKRAVENIVVPGRNGLLTIDQGRYENITVEYPAFAFGKTREEFQQKITAFRNAIMPQIGYQRLEDTYHPDEYRMALYAEGLNVDVKPYGSSGKFTLSFNCKPQRFLRDGEHTVAKANGEKIINPTPYESSPMLEVEGYGTIGFNGYEINIENGTLGEVTLWNGYANAVENSSIDKTVSIPPGLLNNGDTFFINGYTINGYNGVNAHVAGDAASITSYTHSGVSDAAINCRAELGTQTSPFGNYYAHFWINVKFPSLQFEVGTPLSYVDQEHVYYTYTFYGSTSSGEIYIETGVEYDGDSTIRFFERGLASSKALQYIEYAIPQGVGISSNPIMGHPTYIDCDLGEAYKVEDGAVVSLNQYIDLGSKLPTLAGGSNEITYDNTITDLKLIPRWWKI